MDQVHVEAPAFSARAASVEREFYSDFPLVLNYVARLIDDIDSPAAITSAPFRQAAARSRHRPGADSLRRPGGFRAPPGLRRPALPPPRGSRRSRAGPARL